MRDATRLRATHRDGAAYVAGAGRVALEDQVVAEGAGATEISLPLIATYAVVDLTGGR